MARPAKPEEDNNWKIAPTELPEPPSSLKGKALREWNRIGSYLTGLDRVASIDKQSLTAYCTQWAHFERIMSEELAPSSVQLSVDGAKNLIIHPLIPPLVRSAKAVIKLAGQFGLTARTRDLESDHGNRKASALKRLMGNQRKVAESKVGPRMVIPMTVDWGLADVACPMWMNDRAAEEYDVLGQQLQNLDLFTPLDVTPIATVCCLFDLYLRAGEQMNTLYTEVLNKEGEEMYLKEHPLQKVQSEIHDTMQGIWKDYGQTPRYRKVFNGERKSDKREIPITFRGRFG